MIHDKPKLLSIIVPVFNEEENIPLFYEHVTKYLKDSLSRYDYEILFMDNCSKDHSYELLEGLGSQDKHVKAIKFSRNFGYQRSIWTGYCLAKGHAVIQMDCDFQDPPKLIGDFVKLWEAGNQVVYGVRKKRDEHWFIEKARKLFYRLINALAEENLPHDAGDFRLVDRKVVNQIKVLYDANPYIRGMISTMGFKQTGVDYVRSKRVRGKSKFGISQLFGLAIDGILNHSIVPLRLATFTGLGIAIFLMIYVCGLILIKFVFSHEWPAGFATLSILALISISINALFLGVIGEYLGRIYKQVKRQPITIIDKQINVNQSVAETIEK